VGKTHVEDVLGPALDQWFFAEKENTWKYLNATP